MSIAQSVHAESLKYLSPRTVLHAGDKVCVKVQRRRSEAEIKELDPDYLQNQFDEKVKELKSWYVFECVRNRVSDSFL